MAWIESHTVVARHWKTVALAKDLRKDIPSTVGHLHLLWHTVLEQQEDGDLSLWSDERISSAAMFPGRAPQFVLSLITHRWMNSDRTIHDWLDYAGLYLIRKYAKRNKPRLIEIWTKHGRMYGPQESRSDNLATSKQQLLAPQDGRSVNKDSSKMVGLKKKTDEELSAWLARLWLFHRKGAQTDHDRRSADNFEDLLAAGVSAEAIEAEIKRATRPKTEAIWDFCRRMTPSKAKNGTKDRLSGSKAFLEDVAAP